MQAGGDGVLTITGWAALFCALALAACLVGSAVHMFRKVTGRAGDDGRGYRVVKGPGGVAG